MTEEKTFDCREVTFGVGTMGKGFDPGVDLIIEGHGAYNLSIEQAAKLGLLLQAHAIYPHRGYRIVELEEEWRAAR